MKGESELAVIQMTGYQFVHVVLHVVVDGSFLTPFRPRGGGGGGFGGPTKL